MTVYRVTVTDQTGEKHVFEDEDLNFWHDGDVCRVYSREEKSARASFTAPIAVTREKLT